MSVVKTVITGSVFSLLMGAGASLFLLTMPVSLTVALMCGGAVAIGSGAMYGLGVVMGEVDSDADKKELEAEQLEAESNNILNKPLGLDTETLEMMIQKVSVLETEVKTLHSNLDVHREATRTYQETTDLALMSMQHRPRTDQATLTSPAQSGFFSNQGQTILTSAANDTLSEKTERTRGIRRI